MSSELQVLSRTVVRRGKVFDLVVDEVVYPSGARGVREVAHHPGGAVVVPLFEDGQVLLVEQWRYPLQTRILELPAGKLGPGEDPLVAARRELEEETGYTAERLDHLSSIYTTPGFCDEILHIYAGRGLRPLAHGPRREEGELTMTLRILPFGEALAMARDGTLRDAKTIIGLFLAAHRR